MSSILINDSQVSQLAELLKNSSVPVEEESSTHSFKWVGTYQELANSYFAIVAICHQTSAIGERRLEGFIYGNSKAKYGWDYLKERFLVVARDKPKWASCDYWKIVTPTDLSALYDDNISGKTLNRINERTYLINDLGDRLLKAGYHNIEKAFHGHNHTLGGSTGFLAFLKNFEAYRDPVMKKSQFFLSIAMKECGWKVRDPEHLSSPVDYHELRGHLRLGTLTINDPALGFKILHSLPLTESEDTALRTVVALVNDRLGSLSGLTSSIVHYLFWNVFRNCCPRESGKTHCASCGENCGLPDQYKRMPTYIKQCVFSNLCPSSGKLSKVIDPPYTGHFY